MKKNILLIIIITVLQSFTSFAQQLVETFNYTGNVQTYTVPATGKYRLETWGAQGGNDPAYPTTVFGGRGGYSKGELTLTAGTVLYIYVGGQGSGCTSSSWNSTGGGGSSDIRLVGGAWNDNAGLYSRIIVAGGGGGRHGKNYEGATYVGNDGGGVSAPSYQVYGVNITGADQTSGGSSDYGYAVVPGSFGHANPGAQSNTCSVGGWNGGERGSDNWAHGGAGGGWYGGVQSWPAGSGGSGYVLTSTSVKPSGYTPGTAYYIDNTQLIAGNATMPNPAGGNMIGKSGSGAIVITQLYFATVSQSSGVVCNSDLTGELSVAIDGGTAPYTYTWSPNVSSTSTASGLGKGTYSVIVTDANTLSTTASFTIVPSDNTAPVITTNGDKNVNVTPGLCEATVTVSATAADNCSVGAPVGVRSDAKLLSDAYPVGTTTITWNVTDTNGNPGVAVQTVIVQDNILPTAISKNITVQLNTSGSVTVNAADLNNGSTDNCGINNYKLASGSVGTVCNVVGEGSFLSLTAPTGNVFKSIVFASYGNATGTCGNFVMGSCNASNSFSIVSAALLNNNSGTIYSHNTTFGDPCNGTPKRLAVQANYAPATTETASITYSCADLGNHNVVLFVTDNNGNVSSVNATITVEDKIVPTITCAAPALSYNNDLGNCSYAVTDNSLDPTAFADNCTGSTVLNDFNNSATLNGATFPVGTTAVVWTVTDAALNTTTCTYNVVVVDAEAPTITCAAPALSYNNDLGNCSYAVTDTSLDPTAFADNCTGSTVLNDFNNSATLNGATFPVGTTAVVWTVTDASGNTSDCTYNVVVVDAEAPTITCAAPALSYNNDLGNCSYAVTDNSLDPTAFADNCTGSTVLNDFNNSATLNGATFPVGTTAVVWTVTDAALNTTTCTYNVVVVDAEAPTITCAAPALSYNNDLGNCSYAVTDTSLDPTAFADNCTGSTVLNDFNNSATLNGATFPVGTTAVVWTVTDAVLNTTTCTYNVVVVDAEAPIITCAAPALSYNNDLGNCSYTVTDNSLDPTAFADNCAGSTVSNDFNNSATLNGAIFPIGTTAVVWTVTDAALNTTTCTYNVVVVDAEAPTITCAAPALSYNNDLGNCSYAVTDNSLDPTAFADNCTGSSVLNNYTNSATLNGAIFPIGTTAVVWTVTDAALNTTTCTYIVVVVDAEAAKVLTKNITVPLDATGNATIVAADVDNGSSDICGAITLVVAPNTFTCVNVGPNTVTLTATDAKGNVSSQTAIVTIEDKIAPVVVTKNITVQLDITGKASIVAANVDFGSSDVCGTPTLVVTPNTFTCVNVGSNTVTLTATDASGNVSSQTATVTVENKNLPVVATKNITVQLDATGKASITAADVNNGSTVACGTPTLVVSPTTFTCANVGANTVTLTVTDANGNTSSKTATVTIQDKIAAVVVTKNLTVQLDASGNAAITAAQIDNGSSDSCGIASITVSPNTFSCNNVGANTVTLTITDVNGNKSTGTAVVTVQDNMLPTVKTQDLTVELDDAGNASITASQINNGSSDNCGIATVSLDKLSFSCTNVGINTVILTVVDKNGNTATATAKVTVVNTFGDNDNDGILDNCDNDDDNDGISDASDNCPTTANPFQEDRNGNGLGDACDSEQMNISQAFTPNGDGINDTWVISNIELHTNSVVRVFNRWGTEVFVARNYQNDWDGHYKGDSKSLPESSSYYYQIDLDGNGSIDKEGWIYINK